MAAGSCAGPDAAAEPGDGRAAAVAEDGEPVGIAGAWVSAAQPDITHLISMWVAPTARGQGVAGRLIEAVVDWAREHGYSTVELEVVAGNTAALNAYVRSGFTVTDQAPDTPSGRVQIRHVKHG